MSANGWDVAVERCAQALAQAVRDRLDDGRGWRQLLPEVQDRYRDQARAALTAAVGQGGLLLLSEEDVAALGRVTRTCERIVGQDVGMDGEIVSLWIASASSARSELDRLLALLGEETP